MRKYTFNKRKKVILPNCVKCGKLLTRVNAKRCKKCNQKYMQYNKMGVHDPSKKKKRKKYFCLDCNKEISKNAKRCLSCCKKGELNNCYIDGSYVGYSVKYKYPVEWKKTKIREFIRNRDNNKCCICGKDSKENKRKLSVHHIDYNKNNLKENNLISLCNVCHTKTNYNREYWVEFFYNFINTF